MSFGTRLSDVGREKKFSALRIIFSLINFLLMLQLISAVLIT